MDLTERIVIVATVDDKKLLAAIRRLDGDSSMSATVRRLIRAEAVRRDVHVMGERVAKVLRYDADSDR